MTESRILLFLMAAFVIVAGIQMGWRKYRTHFNPVTFELVWSFGFFQVFSAFLSNFTRDIMPLSYDDDSYTKTMIICLVGAITYIVTFYFSPVRLISNKLAAFFSKQAFKNKKYMIMRVFLFTLGIVSFGYLIIGTSGGLLWITEPRLAYIEHRTGAGQFYALYLWALNASFIFLLFEIKNSNRVNFIAYVKSLFIYIIILYFSGSKGAMLTPIVILLFFHDMHINKIKGSTIIYVFTVLSLFSIFSLFFLIGDFNTILMYFSEYFSMTAEYIYRSNEIGHLFGYGLLTDLFSMIPRSVYEDKPYIYGVLHIHNLLTPGQAEAGNTFGILQWSLSYLDFGLIGVIVYYFVKALMGKIIYEACLLRPSIISFTLCITFVFWSPFPFANMILSVLIISAISLAVKMRWL